MRIFAVDTATRTASCALAENGRVICELFSDCGLTHSQTIMRMAENLYDIAGISVESTDVFAATVGPGSFTGLRIGIAAAKGMAQAVGKPCAAISTLEALAMNAYPLDYIAACALDARNNHAYTATFRITDEASERLSADATLAYGDFSKQLMQNHPNDNIIIFGDGAGLLFEETKRTGLHIRKAIECDLNPAASSFARVLSSGRYPLKLLDPGELSPVYLRVPQAVRTLQKKGGHA